MKFLVVDVSYFLEVVLPGRSVAACRMPPAAIVLDAVRERTT